MKVLFVYKFLTMGGVETVLRVRLEGLSEHGIEAHAWFLFDGPGRVIFEDMTSQTHVGSTGMLREFLRKEDFDIVSTLDTEEIFPTMRRLQKHPKLVVEAHSPYPENLEYLRFLGDLPVAAYFVPSQYQAEVIQPKIGRGANIRIIPNPLAERFEHELFDFSPAPNRSVVAWIGRLDDLKNWKEFVDIAGVLRSHSDNIEFWIVGKSSGEDISQKLYDRAKRAAIHDRLRWFRGLPFRYMPRLLDAVRTSGGVVVSTSKGDSFGMTIAEGMARGCAVVVPSQGPFTEFVTENVHGKVYRLGSVQDGTNQILSLLRDDAFRLKCGIEGRKSVLERHAPRPALDILALEFKNLSGSL